MGRAPPQLGRLRGVGVSVFFVVSATLWLAFVLVPSYVLRVNRSLHRRLISAVFGSFWTVRPALAMPAIKSLNRTASVEGRSGNPHEVRDGVQALQPHPESSLRGVRFADQCVLVGGVEWCTVLFLGDGAGPQHGHVGHHHLQPPHRERHAVLLAHPLPTWGGWGRQVCSQGGRS